MAALGCRQRLFLKGLARGEIEHKCYAPGDRLVSINELKGKTKRVEVVEIIGPGDAAS